MCVKVVNKVTLYLEDAQKYRLNNENITVIVAKDLCVLFYISLFSCVAALYDDFYLF